MHANGHLRASLRRPDFRRLFAVRLLGQFGDGVFQASLAGAVLFNPERQAHAADVAAGFAVVLLPYSFVGPFAGVLLDRWWRQRVLVVSNIVRAIGVIGVAVEIAVGVHGQPFYASALVVVSVNRFFLSALSTGLPHVVEPKELVTANALSTTCGAIATTLGGGMAIGVRALIGGHDAQYAAIALAAALPYLASSFTARGFGREQLGPDDVERSHRETFVDVARGLVAGGKHIAARKPALYALIMIGFHRFCYGISTVSALLLYRNYFHDEGIFRAGLAGIGQILATVAIGAGVAALVTPTATRRLGFVRWPALLLEVAAVAQLGLGLPYTMPLLLLAGFVLGFAAQGIKICVDTQLQQVVVDDFRGRVFSLYDTLFNITFVGAAVATAVFLPDSGYSPTSVMVIGIVYGLTGLAYLRVAGRVRQPDPEPAASAAPT
ncbi:MAG TPA: MFS transporter [Jatrophihabitantaceae bacterium]